MTQSVCNDPFLCTGNSVHSILTEPVLRQFAEGLCNPSSAERYPRPDIVPAALKVLKTSQYPTEDLRPKSWDEFAQDAAPQFGLVITVGKDVAGEVCPIRPGSPATGHCGIADPAAVNGTELEREMVFAEAFRYLRLRLALFCALLVASQDATSLIRHLREIGRAEGATDRPRDSI